MFPYPILYIIYLPQWVEDPEYRIQDTGNFPVVWSLRTHTYLYEVPRGSTRTHTRTRALLS